MLGLRSCSIPLVAMLISVPVFAQVEEVRFSNGDTPLVGSLYLPEVEGPAPGIMIIHGSGTSSRSNNWARAFAEELSARGYAVLFPDKRGSGESGGDWQTVGFDVLAKDAIAGAEHARAHPRVDPERVGYLGLSQGGRVAPLAARQDTRAAFAISVVSALQRMEDHLYDEVELGIRAYGLDDETVDYLMGLVRLSMNYIKTGEGWDEYLALHREISAGFLARATKTWPASRDDPYWVFWRHVWDYDPMPHWRHLVGERDLPSLLIYGTGDRNVRVDKSLARAAELEPDPDFTVCVYPGGGHALWDDENGTLRSDMLQDLDRWLGKATAAPADPRSRPVGESSRPKGP